MISGKCSPVWPSSLVRSYSWIHLLQWHKTSERWLFYFSTCNKNVRWSDGHHPLPWPLPPCPPPPPHSCSLSSCSSSGRGTLLVGVASPSTVETFLISLREKKLKFVIRQCSFKEMLLTRSTINKPITENPYLYDHTFWSYLQCLHTAAFVVGRNKIVCAYVCIRNRCNGTSRGFFIWSLFNFISLSKVNNNHIASPSFFLFTFKSLRNYLNPLI